MKIHFSLTNRTNGLSHNIIEKLIDCPDYFEFLSMIAF